MGFLNLTSAEQLELQKMQEDAQIQLQKKSDYEQNQAAVILETELKNRQEREEQDRYNKNHYSHSNDMFGGLIDSIANAVTKCATAVFEWRQQQIIDKKRDEALAKIEKEVENLLLEAKSIGDLEKRTVEAKRIFEAVDREYKHIKGDTGEERLRLNKNLNKINEIQEQCRKIKDKDQEINISNFYTVKKELNRCYEKENVIEYKMTNAELKQHLTNSASEMKEKSTAATEKMKIIYKNSKDWKKHDRYTPADYYYTEPPAKFTGEGIPKDSVTGQALREQMETRNQMETNITQTKEIQNTIAKLPDEQEHIIKVTKGDDLLQKIHEKIQDLSKDQQQQQQPEIVLCR